MSTTVTYKGNTLTTVNNTTKTLKTAGKYMEGDVVLTDVTEEYIGGAVYQDQDGYLVLSDQGSGSSVTVEALNVTQNGTYTAPTGKAYSPVTVSVSGDEPTPTPTPTPWVRPSEWPDLSKMDVSAGDVIYMTSYADEARGFCSFQVNCTGDYTVEIGSISGSTFVADSTQSYANNVYCDFYYGSSAGGYKVFRITGRAIKRLGLRYGTALTIDGHACYANNQGIIDIVGKLPSSTGLTLQSLYNLVNVEISGIVFSGTCSNLFYNCYSLTSVDTSGWDISNVTTMNNMFANCHRLTHLDVSGWETGSVTNMSYMFQYCNSLAYLDVSGWETGSVTTMANMFSNCNSLASLDVSEWDTSDVESMSGMFQNCYALTSIDVSGWDTGSVTTTYYMFSGCNSLTSIDAGGWETGSVTNMGYMFSNCSSLTSLDVSGWDTGSVTTMANMFYACNSLTALDVSGWTNSNVTTMANMFYNCNSLASLDVSGWETGSVTTMTCMFQNCYSLISLDVSGWDTGDVTTMSNMFQYCNSITSLDVSEWDTGNVTNMAYIFGSCNSLTSIDVSGWDFSKVTTSSYATSIFASCYSLRGPLTLPATMSMIGSSCFNGCRTLTEWHFLSATPPTLSSTGAFSNMDEYGGKKIYVPAASLSAYQTAANWSTYASYMVGE